VRVSEEVFCSGAVMGCSYFGGPKFFLGFAFPTPPPTLSHLLTNLIPKITSRETLWRTC
jgi:hypothetical protein